MTSWTELENRFRELEPLLRSSRIDAQWGHSGEYWRIAGGSDLYAVKRFETISRIAGEKLRQALLSAPESQREITDELDPVRCWYKGIAYIGKNFNYGFTAEALDEKGNVVGHIYTGRINRIAEASAILCLELSSHFGNSSPSPQALQKVDKASNIRSILEKYGVQIIIGIIVTVIGGIILDAILR